MRKTLEEAVAISDGFYIVSGCGDDSAMMIAECYVRGFEPKAVIFCDTGNEMPHTYKFLANLSLWMLSKGWSRLVVIKNKNQDGDVINVYDENYKNGNLPPPVYNYKTCSQRFKMTPADRWIAVNEGYSKNNGTQTRINWKGWSKKIVKAVGINADEEHRVNRWQSDDNFEQVFPLNDWDIGEKESKDLVEGVGLYMPGKSSCFMCPNMTAKEIIDLHEKYPLMFHKAIAMEYKALDKYKDGVSVNRVFARDKSTGSEVPLRNALVKKTDRKIDIERTISEMPKKIKSALKLENNQEQFDMFGPVDVELVIKSVTEKTQLIGLGRTCSWLDVLSEYQMTGQVEMFKSVGGGTCGNGGCGT